MTKQHGFTDVADLEERLSRPDDKVLTDLDTLDGDIMVLGASGKVGPTLARMAKRACPDREVYAVARFTDASLMDQFRSQGIVPIRADLLDTEALRALPFVKNVVLMAGYKFGASDDPSRTWAVNTLLSARVAEILGKRRMVAFSTGCVYPFVSNSSGGATEDTPLTPLGEYANSCVGRERVMQWEASRTGTDLLMFRLNYAIECRYGVIHDIAQKIMSGDPIDVSTGHVNVIWQGDSNAMALRALVHCQTHKALNATGPETVQIRWLAEQLGRRLGKTAQFVGQEAEMVWLNNASRAFGLMGYPTVALETMIDWTAAWVKSAQPSLNKPTGFDVRDGAY